MSIGVCMLARNRNAYLSRVIEGIERSRLAPREVIIARVGGEDPRPVLAGARRTRTVVVEVASEGDLIPYSLARNRAASLATSDHLLFLDADTIPGAHALGALDAALAERDAICTGEIWYLPPDAVHDDWTEDSLSHLGRRHEGRPPAPPLGTLRCRPELIWGTCLAMRRTRFLELNGFDEGYRGYAGEDTDLAIRASAAGVSAQLVGAADVYHQFHEAWRPPLQQFRATIENARRFRTRHGWWPMQGWLRGFEDLGLIEWEGAELRVRRDPTSEEVDSARIAAALPRARSR